MRRGDVLGIAVLRRKRISWDCRLGFVGVVFFAGEWNQGDTADALTDERASADATALFTAASGGSSPPK